MYSSDFMVRPKTLDEAYSAYQSVSSSVLVAGAWGLKHTMSAHYDLAIHLSNLGLDYIRDDDGEIHIGAMTSFETIQRSAVLQSFAGGVLAKCAEEIGNSTMKRCATVGGMLAVKHPFSRMLPALLALQVDVRMYHKGCMGLDDYLYCPPMGELITEISIAREPVYAVRKTLYQETGVPWLIGAVSVQDALWRVVLGGRPGLAVIAEKASHLLTERGISMRDNAAHVAGEELEFGSDALCPESQRRGAAEELVRELVNAAWHGADCRTGKAGKKH